MLKIVVIGNNLFRWIDFLREQVKTDAEITYLDTYDEEKVCALIEEVDAAVTMIFTPAMGKAAKRLRLIQLPGAGYDKIHHESIPPGVIVANCYEHEQGIAEWTLMMCLALCRKLIEADSQLRQGDWSLSPVAGAVDPYPELGGKTMGIVGLGRIGRAVASLCRAFRMRCVGSDIAGVSDEEGDELGLDFVGGGEDLDQIVQQSDFLTIAVPLNAFTRGLVGERELASMKPTAYLINPARGPIVDEKALFEALRDRKIAGAALDAWYIYCKDDGRRISPSMYPFHSLSNVLMTPHISGWTEQTMRRRFEIVAANIDRFAKNETLMDVVPGMSRAT